MRPSGRGLRLLLGLGLALCLVPVARAVELQSIVRVKGQEPLQLRGMGLITGLPGTGDSRFTPMHRALFQAMNRLGSSVQSELEVATARNVALVAVTCEIPGVGGREGGRFDCFVTSIGTARGLGGGRLITTPLTGPRLDDDTAYAIAEGPISLEDEASPNHGRIELGARLLQDLYNPFVKCEETVTLVVDTSHATFVTASDIAERINTRFQAQLPPPSLVAYAVDARNVELLIPAFARRDPVRFLADVLRTPIPEPHTEARVVVNERTGTIVVTGEVEITPTLVAHRNLLLLPIGEVPIGVNPFVPLTGQDPPFPDTQRFLSVNPVNLNDLLLAFNRAQISADDQIEIIKELAKSGKLHAKVIYE